MKKVLYVSIAVSAFFCGVGVFYVRPLLVPLSLFELRQNISRYKSRDFKVIGKLEVTEFDSTYFVNIKDWENECSAEPKCFRGLQLSERVLRENFSLLEEIAEKNHTIGKTDFRHIEYYADVEITGSLVETENQYFTVDSSYDIKVEAIEYLSPVKFVLLDNLQKR